MCYLHLCFGNNFNIFLWSRGIKRVKSSYFSVLNFCLGNYINFLSYLAKIIYFVSVLNSNRILLSFLSSKNPPQSDIFFIYSALHQPNGNNWSAEECRKTLREKKWDSSDIFIDLFIYFLCGPDWMSHCCVGTHSGRCI